MPARAQDAPDDPALPSPLCALSNHQLICYEQQTAAPHVLSAPGQQVIDFAFAPDGNWLAYRADSTVTIVPNSATGNDANRAFTVDSQAPPPLDITPATITLAWSSDARAIAYVTAFGLRIALPPDAPSGTPRYLNDLSRPYTNVHFSKGGHFLAAQSDDGQWTIFTLDLDKGALQPSREIAQAGEMAWFDDSNFVFAPLSGGLERLDAAGSNSPAWTVSQDHFAELLSTSSGQVLATHPDPGDTIGSVVSISPDGTVTPLGNSKIDSRVVWGPDGKVMLYIDSGTPIFVDRGTGIEDMLPVHGVSRVAWSPPPPTLGVTSIPLDADLYFLSPDNQGRDQLWRLPRSGKESARPLTAEPYTVLDYAIRADGKGAVITSGGQLLSVTFDPNGPADPANDTILALLDDSGVVSQGGQPDWQPDGKGIAFRDRTGLYWIPVNSDNSLPGTPQAQVQLPKLTPFLAGSFFHPRFSPNGRRLLVDQGDPGSTKPIEVDLSSAQTNPNQKGVSAVSIRAIIGTNNDKLAWADDSHLIAFSQAGQSGNLRLISLLGLPASSPSPGTQDASASVALIDPSWRVADARINPANGSLVLLREIGWPVGPEVVQGYTATLDSSGTVGALQLHGQPGAISRAAVSPTGNFAVGIERIGTIDSQVILDIATSNMIRIEGIPAFSNLDWQP